jgi:iron complex outermembrane receptor protein
MHSSWRQLPHVDAESCLRPRKAESANFVKSLILKAFTIAVLVSLVLSSRVVVAAPSGEQTDSKHQAIGDMSLEQLLDVKVTSAAKHEERVSNTAAAIYVISQDDIRRSGATSLPEVLRTVPGLTVERMNASTWVVSARGFADQRGNKLLVLMDGRTLYDAFSSGVYWDIQNPLLDDIERIEVIRGPGGALWGANAVNGVINIISKRAKDTQGTLIVAEAGITDKGAGAARYGGHIGDKVQYRLYSKYSRTTPLVDAFGKEQPDGWNLGRGGFRADAQLNSRDSLTLQGDLLRGREDGIDKALDSAAVELAALTQFDNPTALRGQNLLARWTRTFSKSSDLSLQFYVDNTTRDSLTFDSDNRTYDLDFQMHRLYGSRNNIVWGSGFRFNRSLNHVLASGASSFNPDHYSTYLGNAFVQDEISLFPDRLRLTVGTKIEGNNFSGANVQPTARILWTPNQKNSLWAAVSRAVRTPSGLERSRQAQVAAFPGDDGITNVIRLNGNPNLRPENLIAYEFGYRIQPNHKVSFDLATFYNHYTNLRSEENLTPFLETVPGPTHLVIPAIYGNNLYGKSFGAEIATTWMPAKAWKLLATYSWLDMSLKARAGSTDSRFVEDETSTPRHQASVHSSYNLTRQIEIDTSIRFVDRLVEQDTPGYTEVNSRLSWRVAQMEFSLVGQNLLRARQLEYNQPDGNIHSWVRRNIYGQIRWAL